MEIVVKKNISNLFSFGKTKPLPEHTAKKTLYPSDRQLDEASANVQHIEPQQLVYGCGQSVGKQREHNEDCIFALSVAVGGEPTSLPLGLFIVADGMGGHQYGEVASSTAVRTLAGYLLKQFHSSLVNPSTIMEESIRDVMRSAIGEAQRAVTQTAPGSGTTLTAAIVLGQQMTIGHVGDSRAYAIHPNGGGEILTRDHSLVKRLEELGQISSEEAAIHPQRNVLYRALGQGEILEPDIFSVPFPLTGYLLLCSDGLWSVLSDNNLFHLVSSAQDLQTACQSLVAAANEAGGPDNISVIMVKLAA
jgi:PPM family protein phosphatase